MHYDYVLHSTKRTVGGTEYIIKNDIGFLDWFASSYSQLIIKDLNGERIVYDVNSLQFFKIASVFILTIAFAIIVIIGVIKEDKKMQNKEANEINEILEKKRKQQHKES